ncbi:MAG: hypothetical protein N3A62_08860 [Thermodesulfovibrionales bacterium]|nr:hypothetical protein [Thermodesulfovibrionales bacterium]
MQYRITYRMTLFNRWIWAIDNLSDEKLKVAIDFITYLKDKEDMEATLEILSSHEIMAQIKEAERSLQDGKSEDFIPWEKIRRNV